MPTLVAKPLVKETTTTTGTGSYTLSGVAAAGCRRFQDAYTPGTDTYVPYFVRENAAYEYGIGKLSAVTTLERYKVLGSSNADAAVNWTGGTRQVYVSTGEMMIGKHNLAATVSPTVNDDFSDGYGTGSLWVGKYLEGGVIIYRSFICIDPGLEFGPGNAHWKQIGHDGFLRLTDEAGTDYGFDNAGLGFTDAVIGDFSLTRGAAALPGEGAKIIWRLATVMGLGWSASQAAWGGHQNSKIGYAVETSDATPTNPTINNYGAGFEAIMEPDSAMMIEMSVVARCDADNDMKAWKLQALVERDGTGTPTIVGTSTVTVIGASAGAAAWDADITIDATNKAFQPELTGSAAKTIRWSVYADVTQVANR